MKKLLIAICLVAGFSFTSSAQFTFGGGASYIFPGGGSFGFQAKSLIGINENIDFSPSIGIYLQDGTPFEINADVHYDLLEIGDGFRILPFAGLNYVNAVTSDLGLNLGASIRFDINDNTVYIEPKLILVKTNGMALAAGLLF